MIHLHICIPPVQAPIGVSDSVKCGTLRSTVVRDTLTTQMVEPVLARGWTVAAFRMNWSRQTDEALQYTWDNIVSIRQEMDQAALQLPGLQLLVSAISATSSRLPKENRYRNSPGVAYWGALTQGMDTRSLIGFMQENSSGAQLKLQLQPFQKTKDHVCNALFTVVKDNMEGCVRRLVEEAQRRNHRDVGVMEPIVKLYVRGEKVKNFMLNTVLNLAAARFSVELLEM